MLKALIRKQYSECFRSYFVNQKTGKANSKGKIVGMFIFFAVLMLFLCSIGFGMGFALDEALTAIRDSTNGLVDIRWLGYALLGVASILFGVFGSVFNTYASLYLPKDNEQLLAMPIKPGKILLSRLSLVYLLSLLYSGIVWVPGVLAAVVNGHATVTGAIFGILLALVIALLVSVLTCALGWVIALIATRVRSKSIISVVLGLGFFIVYYIVCFNASDLFEKLLGNLQSIAEGVKGSPLAMLGMAAMGSVSDMLLVSGAVLLLAVACYVVMSRSYMSLLLRKPKSVKGKFSMDKSVQRSVSASLFARELKRFGSSTTYMMNSGMGIALVPVLTVVVIIYVPKLEEAITLLTSAWAPALRCIPMLAPLMLSFMLGMAVVSLPSVSLEGKNIWILQTLPVSGWDVLRSKRDLHIVLTTVPAVVCAAVLAFVLPGAGALWAVMTVLFVIVFDWFNADLGLVLGVKHCNLKWTNETIAIKQNMWTLLVMVINLAITIAMGGAALLLINILEPVWTLAIVTVLIACITLLMEKWLRGKGARIFETLQ